MSRKFLVPIDLNKNELQNPLLQSIAGDVGTPGVGQFWYDSTNNLTKVKYAAGIKILPFITSTGPIAEAVGSSQVTGTSTEAARHDHVHAMPGNASTGVDGFMPGTDKTKLDAATASSTLNTLVMRDGNSRFQAADPSAAQDVATKNYVDSMAQGLDIKASVRVASATAVSGLGTTYAYSNTGGTSGRGQITWSAGPTAIDGVTLTNGDRILNKSEGSANAVHGIWVRTSADTWDRSTDFDSDAEATAGSFVFVEEGTVNADTGWVLNTDNVIVLGGASGTALDWTQFSGAAGVIAGAGLTKTGNTLDVGAGTGITVNANDVAITTNGVTGALFRQSAALSVVGNATNGTANVADIAAGADYNILRRSGTAIGFGAIDLSQSGAVGSSVLGAANGGTAQATWTTGDLMYATAANTLGKRAVGSTGELLSVVGGLPTWQSTTTLSLTKKYSVAVGNGALTSITVTHNLGSRDVVVNVYLTVSAYDEVVCDVQMTTANTVTLTFSVAPTASQYTCVVIG